MSFAVSLHNLARVLAVALLITCVAAARDGFADDANTNLRPPTLEKPKDLVGILTSLEEGDILFIDEIHRLGRVVEEFLYPAMEDYQIDLL